MDNNISISQEDLDNLTYSEFLSHFTIYPTYKEAQKKGFEAHHIIPKAAQKKNGITRESPEFDDRCIRCTSFEHILAHYLMAKENIEYSKIFECMIEFNSNKLNSLENIKFLTLKDWGDLREKGLHLRCKGKTAKEIYGDDWIDPKLGRKRCNNGIKEILCYPNDIPEGFVIGSLYTGYKIYNNGIKEIRVKEGSQPEGYTLGILTTKKNRTMKEITGNKDYVNPNKGKTMKEITGNENFISSKKGKTNKEIIGEEWTNPKKGRKQTYYNSDYVNPCKGKSAVEITNNPNYKVWNKGLKNPECSKKYKERHENFLKEKQNGTFIGTWNEYQHMCSIKKESL